jgi:hypothetical protein
MLWSRTEEGMEVTVILKRIDKLPTAPPDKLYGIWNLNKVEKEGVDVSEEFRLDENAYLFIRWDKRFEMQFAPDDRLSGIFNTHGHRTEVEFIYNNDCIRERYAYVSGDSTLMLELLSGMDKTVFHFSRSNQLPD